MHFKQFFDTTSSTFTYLFADETSGNALIIDPVKPCVEEYLTYLAQHDFALHYCIDTHTHADHITAAADLKAATHCFILSGDPDCCGTDLRIADGDTITLDSLELSAIHTPGHTPHHYCFYINQTYVVTGDCLLINGCGRTDFQGGSAKTLYHSIINKLFSLPEDTIVLPGHDYRGNNQSTIGAERASNPRLANKTEAEFITIMDNLDLERPKLIDIAVPANLKSGSD